MDPDCHYGDHLWEGTSRCVRCGERLRCYCGAYVRADNMDGHIDSRCRWVAKPVPVCWRCEWVATDCVCPEGPHTGSPEPDPPVIFPDGDYREIREEL